MRRVKLVQEEDIFIVLKCFPPWCCCSTEQVVASQWSKLTSSIMGQIDILCVLTGLRKNILALLCCSWQRCTTWISLWGNIRQMCLNGDFTKPLAYTPQIVPGHGRWGKTAERLQAEETGSLCVILSHKFCFAQLENFVWGYRLNGSDIFMLISWTWW